MSCKRVIALLLVLAFSFFGFAPDVLEIVPGGPAVMEHAPFLARSAIPDALAACDSNTKLALNLNSNLTDSSASAHTVSATGSPTYTTTNQKYGSAAIILNGSSQYLTVPDHADWDVGTGDFSVRFWAWWDATGGNYFLYSRGGDPVNNFNLFHSSNTMYVYLMGVQVTAGYSFTPTLDTWYYIHVKRSGTSLTLEINGSVVDSATDSTNIVDTTDLVIGWRSGATYFPGQIDDFEFANVARSSTVPTSELCGSGARGKCLTLGVGD